MQKLNKVVVLLYVLFLVSAFFYVKSVIRGVPVSQEDGSRENTVDVKNITVTLIVKSPESTKTYVQESKSVDTVADLLLKVKENNPGFTFDRTSYSYGSEFDQVNNIKTTETMKWRIFDGETDITLKMDDTVLVDEKSYTLSYQSI